MEAIGIGINIYSEKSHLKQPSFYILATRGGKSPRCEAVSIDAIFFLARCKFRSEANF
jgi:hypothetical protein